MKIKKNFPNSMGYSKAVIRDKPIGTQAYFKKQEKSKIKNLNDHL